MEIGRFTARGAFMLLALATLAGCQSAPMPTGSPTPTDGMVQDGSGGEGDSSEVDTSEVEGAPAAEGLVDPCSLLSADEVEAALGVAVLAVVRSEVKDDGSQFCAFSMDAQGATAAAMAGQPGFPSGGLGDVVNGLEAGGAVVGVMLSAQDPEDSGTDAGDEGDDDLPPGVQIQKLPLGKAGFVTVTPNGGAAIVANEQNVLLTIMDLIAGPPDAGALTALVTTAYGRL